MYIYAWPVFNEGNGSQWLTSCKKVSSYFQGSSEKSLENKKKTSEQMIDFFFFGKHTVQKIGISKIFNVLKYIF